MTTEQKIKKLIDYYNLYNSQKLWDSIIQPNIFMSNSNDGNDSNSVLVESYEDANKIYRKLVFRLQLLTVGGQDYLPNDDSVDTDSDLFLIMKIENKEMEYYEKVVESVVALHNMGVNWELFSKTLINANNGAEENKPNHRKGNSLPISEWIELYKNVDIEIDDNQLVKIFDYHINRVKLAPTNDTRPYADKNGEEFYLEIPHNWEEFFRIERLSFKFLESQKKAHQSTV